MQIRSKKIRPLYQLPMAAASNILIITGLKIRTDRHNFVNQRSVVNKKLEIREVRKIVCLENGNQTQVQMFIKERP